MTTPPKSQAKDVCDNCLFSVACNRNNGCACKCHVSSPRSEEEEMGRLMQLLEYCLSPDSPPIVSLLKRDAQLILDFIRSLEASLQKSREENEKMRVACYEAEKALIMNPPPHLPMKHDDVIIAEQYEKAIRSLSSLSHDSK